MQLPAVTVLALVAVLGALVAVRGRFLRGRLGFAAVMLLCALVLDVALARGIGDPLLVGGLARLMLTAGGILSAVSLLFNPWRLDRVSDRVPAIVQDVIVIALFAVAATALLDEKMLTTSAVGAVVVGFALQDTLGNLFSGLAIQVEKPFRVGQWIRVGDFEGKVEEVTWRATKLVTKAGQFVIVPNSTMSKDAILNFSEPTEPTRLEVIIGASYDAPPNLVKQALHEALENAPLVLQTPRADVVIEDFSSSSVSYRVRFWIADYARDSTARDQVRSNIWYTFKRRDIEIPYPMQVEYSREEVRTRPPERLQALAERLGKIDLFTGLDDVECARLADACPERIFGAGERVVRQGAAGQSMFVVLDGAVRVTLEPSGQDVAVIGEGGFFGEMSMLTGEPRTATVTAVDDAVLLEISSDRFREQALRRPALVEHVSNAVATRRTGLAEAQAAADQAQATVPAPQSLLRRIQQFLRV
ncbi:MAG: mechanosensitive ion channel family protein [Acidobacteriota bacterium]